jgi:hypothetical protein
MGLGGGALLGVAMTRSALAADDVLKSPLETFVRIRARLDGQRVFWAYFGTLYGRLETEPGIPLMNVMGVGIDQLTRSKSGGFDYENNEVGYFTDLETGAPLGQWVNPLNGARCQIKSYKSAQQAHWRPDLSVELATSPKPGVELTARGLISGPKVEGDSVWMNEDLFLKAKTEGGGIGASQLKIATSLSTFHASLTDLRSPSLELVPAQLYYTTLGSWRPDMNMGDVPGVLSWRMTAEKAATPVLISPELRRWIDRDYPGFLN